MKRCGAPLGEPCPQRKRAPAFSKQEAELPSKIRMLQNWQITPEAARFLEINDRIDPNRVSDATCPQLCLMVYAPNCYQPLIDALPRPDSCQLMEIEGVELTEG